MNIYEKRIAEYREEFGEPTCKTCGIEVGFKKRGQPKKFCSSKCSGKAVGFGNPEVQDKIKEVVREKYGVDNVAQLDSVKEKLSRTGEDNPFYGKQHTKEHKQKVSLQAKERWKDPEYKARVSASIKRGTNSTKELRRRREWARDNWDLSGRISKVHLKIRDELGLGELGFESEQPLLGYSIDELHKSSKIVVEINGDYVHANPSKFKPFDLITIKSSKYTAFDKWKSDATRTNMLEEAGYTVFIIWESDSNKRKQKIKEEIQVLLMS